MALQDIIDKIINDAKQEANQIIQQGEEEYKKTLKDEKLKLDDSYEKKQMRLNTEIENYRIRQQQVVDLESRKKLLQTKQDEIASFFSTAKEKLIHLSENEYQEIMLKILEKSIEHKDSTIIIGEYDTKRLNASFIDKANKKGYQLQLSEETIPLSYGFVLASGNVEINCTLESLLKQKKEELIISLNKMIQD